MTDRILAHRRPASSGSAPAAGTDLDAATRTARVLVALGLVAIAIAVFFKYPLTGRSLDVQLGQYAIVICAAFGVATSMRAGRPRYASLVFWLFTYCVLGIVQSVQLGARLNPFGVDVTDEDVVTQQLIILAGCGAFAVASNAAIRWRPSDRRPLARAAGGPDERGREVVLRRTVWCSVGVLLACVYFYEALGGVGALLGSRQAVGERLVGTGHEQGAWATLIAGLANAGPLVCLLALVHLRARRIFTFRDRPDLAALAGLLLLANLIFNNPISQPRYWVATIVVAVAMSGPWARRIRFQAAFIAAFVLAALIAFPFLDRFRYEGSSRWQYGVVDAYLSKTDYGSAQDITNAVTYVEDNGHTGGRQLLGAALFAVPRSIWPGKPTDSNALLAEHIGFPNPNIDSPLWAEGYIDFGLPGTVVLLGLFGALTGRCDAAREGLGAARSISAVFVPIFVGYELILLRGSLLQATARIAAVTLFCLAVSEVVAKRRPQRAQRLAASNPRRLAHRN